MSLLVNPEWETLLASVDTPDGREIRNDVVLQCHLILSLIFYLGISFHNLITFLIETPITKAKRHAEQFRLFVHRANCPKAPTIHDLPAELIHSIFERAVIPSYLLDSNSSRSAGRNSAWSINLRTTKTLMQVSKLWYYALIPFLYETITIREPQQIQQLLSSLQDNALLQIGTESIGHWVRGLDIICGFFYKTRSLDEDLVDENEQTLYDDFAKVLQAVIRLCPLLTTFRCSFHPCSPKDDSATSLIACLPDTITRLALNFEGNQARCYRFLSFLVSPADNLTSLSIEILHRGTSTSTDKPSVFHIHFRNLVDLRCHGPAALELAAEWWTLPVLSRFTYLPKHPYPVTLPPTLRTFLERHGSRIVFLNLICLSSMSLKDHSYIFESCPKLQRLIFPISLSRNDDLPLGTSFPKALQWIESHNSHPVDSHRILELLHTNIPAFKGFRAIAAPISVLPADWLELLPPGLYIENEDQGFSIDLYTYRIRYFKEILWVDVRD